MSSQFNQPSEILSHQTPALTAFEFATLNPPAGLSEIPFQRPILDSNGVFDEYIASLSISKQLMNPYSSVESSLNQTQLKLFNFLQTKISTPEKARDIMSNHYFVITGFISLLLEARKNHTVPCTDFIWLKKEDRTMWYSLHSVGSTCFIEGAGAHSHWMAEILNGTPIDTPQTYSAVYALEILLRE
jgi:hypothetical protein